MKVMYVIPGSPDDQTSMIFARRQVSAVARAGIQTEIFYLQTRTNPIGLLSELYRFRKNLRFFSPDIVHSQYGSVTAAFALGACNYPLIVTFRGSDLNPIPSARPLRSQTTHLLSHVASLRASVNICVSHELQSRLSYRARARSLVLPNGVPLAEFPIMHRNDAREQLGWPTDQPVILFNAGRSPKVKRLDLAEKAYRIVQSTIPTTRLCVIDGTHRPADVVRLLNASDLLLVTSDFEGSPNIVKEAVVTNLPVVSVDVGDVALQIANVKPGKIVERDPEQIARAIIEVLRLGVRSNGRDRRGAELDDRCSANILLDTYRGLMATCLPREGKKQD
jgi:teichuronic acid biosynthesis glycosyltransferase TuaC